MNCDICENETATFIVGNAETGEQHFMGPGCFARFGLEYAKKALPAEEIAAQLGPMLVSSPEAPSQEAKRGGRGRRKPASVVSTQEGEGPPAEPAEGDAREAK